MSYQKNIYFIILFPKRSGNLGAIARVMKNFSFFNLRVVTKKKILNTFETKKMAVHAFDIIQKAEQYENLHVAISDLNLVIGATGKFHKDSPTLVGVDFLERVVNLAKKNKIGILFGPEDRGLSNEELSLCSYTLTIPANPLYPSLNLSHAVGLVAWEIFKCTVENKKLNRKLARRESMERLYDMMNDVYTEIGFLDKINPTRIMKVLRSLYDRAELDEREVRVLMGILKQSKWYMEHLKKEGAINDRPLIS